MRQALNRCILVAIVLACAGCAFFGPPEPIDGPSFPPMPAASDVAGEWIFVDATGHTVLKLNLTPDGVGTLTKEVWGTVARGGPPHVVRSQQSVAWSVRSERPAGIQLQVDGESQGQWRVHADSMEMMGAFDEAGHVTFVRRSFLMRLLEDGE